MNILTFVDLHPLTDTLARMFTPDYAERFTNLKDTHIVCIYPYKILDFLEIFNADDEGHFIEMFVHVIEHEMIHVALFGIGIEDRTHHYEPAERKFVRKRVTKHHMIITEMRIFPESIDQVIMEAYRS